MNIYRKKFNIIQKLKYKLQSIKCNINKNKNNEIDVFFLKSINLFKLKKIELYKLYNFYKL